MEVDEDVFYTQRQLQDSPHRTKRKISSDDDMLWPGGVVHYEFDGTHCKYNHTVLLDFVSTHCFAPIILDCSAYRHMYGLDF